MLLGGPILIRRPPLAACNVSGEKRKFVQKPGRPEPQQCVHHHQVARAERSVEPLGIAEPTGKIAQACADAIPDQRHAFGRPRLVAFLKLGGHEFQDRRFHGIDRGEYPCGARALALASSGSGPA